MAQTEFQRSSLFPHPYSIELRNFYNMLQKNDTESNKSVPRQQQRGKSIRTPPPYSLVTSTPVTAQPNELTPSTDCSLGIFTFKIQNLSRLLFCI